MTRKMVSWTPGGGYRSVAGESGERWNRRIQAWLRLPKRRRARWLRELERWTNEGAGDGRIFKPRRRWAPRRARSL